MHEDAKNDATVGFILFFRWIVTERTGEGLMVCGSLIYESIVGR